jgi:hypothetical protein
MGKIENYALLDETIRCEFEELWTTGTSFVNDQDVDEITGLCAQRGLAHGYHLDVAVIGNGLTCLSIRSD